NVSSTGNRYDASLNSQITPRVGNNAEVTVGSIQDPLQINSEDRLTLRDTVSFPIKRHTVLLGVEHDRVQPSLLAKLNQELNLLSPALQAQFLADPSGFIDSSNFPPEIKALLAAEQPTGTSISASTIFEFGSKIRFSPTVSATHSANGGSSSDWTQTFGYTFSCQFRPTLQFRSSLNNLFFWDTIHNTAQRTTLLSFGFQKTFMAAPGTLAFFHRSRMIEGRVFRDNNINGAFNAGEPGMQGVEVRLDDGQVAITDELGRYKFPSVSADQHAVSIALTQFRNPVRMTTRSEADVDLIQQRIAVINFGILDFARVMGNVYNDLRFDNARQPDSKGMQDIQLLLDNGKEVRKIQTAGSGDFELDDVPPGDYKLSIDPASIPPSYITPIDSVAVHVSPVSTVVQDIPVRALRSISGTVLLRTAIPTSEPADRKRAKGLKAGSPASTMPSQEFKLVPLAGVQIAAGPATATTNGEGKFLLRNLPAGELKVTVVPLKPVPAGMNIPSGVVKMPAEPVQVQGATIVISNPELMPYLTGELHNGTSSVPTDQVATVKHPVLPAKPLPSIPTNTVQAPIPVAATSTTATSPAQVTPKPLPQTDAVGVPTTVPDGVLTREVCNQMPSLGEVAQCLRQLKLNSSGDPK
ncbi:MAG TPA: SdrD B-like domain-containing protein, partial [Acidobacteriaceae bacterium]|nr:SdrD B-like domain-containing protein [Acidobacteriaceae bacterium]